MTFTQAPSEFGGVSFSGIKGALGLGELRGLAGDLLGMAGVGQDTDDHVTDFRVEEGDGDGDFPATPVVDHLALAACVEA